MFYCRGAFENTRRGEGGAEGVPTLGQAAPLFGVHDSRARSQGEQEEAGGTRGVQGKQRRGTGAAGSGSENRAGDGARGHEEVEGSEEGGSIRQGRERHSQVIFLYISRVKILYCTL